MAKKKQKETMREQLAIGQEAFVEKLRDSLNPENNQKEPKDETIQSTENRKEMVRPQA